MEKVTFQNTRDLTLVGHLHPSPSPAIVILCHGFRSNKSSRGRFDRFAQAFHQHGYGVLAFDFSGCGESDDDSLTLAKQVDDLRSAIRYVQSLGYRRIALYGHSLGARVCLEAFDPQDVSTMVLSGAGTGPIRYHWPDHFSGAQMKELRETGQITVYQSGMGREKVIIDRQMLLDFEQFEQETLLKRITCPVLILHGDQGWEEQQLAEITRKGYQWLTKDTQVRVIEGADHSFMDRLSEVEQAAVSWYLNHCPPF